jgi:hypothetical protein
MVVSAIAGRLEVLALSARGLKKIEDEMVSEARQHSLITSALPLPGIGDFKGWVC